MTASSSSSTTSIPPRPAARTSCRRAPTINRARPSIRSPRRSKASASPGCARSTAPTTSPRCATRLTRGAHHQVARAEGDRRLLGMHAQQAAADQATVQQGGARAASAWCASASASTRTSAPAITPASGCPAVPSLSVKRTDDPLKDDPVAAIDNTCVGCGNCGEVSEAAVLCPSFYRADIIHNPTGIDRFLAKMRAAVIGFLQRRRDRRRISFA